MARGGGGFSEGKKEGEKEEEREERDVGERAIRWPLTTNPYASLTERMVRRIV